MVDVEKEMMKEIMADYHSGDPRKVASAKEQILNKAQRLITFMIKKYFPTYIPRTTMNYIRNAWSLCTMPSQNLILNVQHYQLI